MSHHINYLFVYFSCPVTAGMRRPFVTYLLSVTGRNIVVGQLVVIIILVIKILQSFLLLKFTELKTQE